MVERESNGLTVLCSLAVEHPKAGDAGDRAAPG
jgi:hypothetical protein